MSAFPDHYCIRTRPEVHWWVTCKSNQIIFKELS
jgi:hypothetical protein